MQLTRDEVIDLERRVQEKTGLGWELLCSFGPYHAWRLTAPTSMGRINLEAQSDPDDPELLYAFNIRAQNTTTEGMSAIIEFIGYALDKLPPVEENEGPTP